MNYIQYMKPGGNFGDKLKTGIKKFLKAAGEASRMAKDARINNPGAAMIRDAYAKGDEELAKLLTDEMQAANLTGIALGSGAAPLITGFTVAPVTTGVTLATGMAGGMAGMYGTDKAINYFSDGKYTGWGNWINQATNGAIGENTAGFFHPGAIFGGFATGKIGNKIVGVANRGKLELLNSALNNNILATTLQPTVADEAILRGQLGWAPKQTIPYRHGSKLADLKTFVPKHDRWDVVTHGADPNMYFVTDLSTPVSAANMMDLRPYQYTGSIVAEKPMVQVGDFNIAGKNATRNQLIARARQQGADAYLLQDIVDNKVPHLNVVARFIGPEGEAVQGGAASIKWYGPTMGKTTAAKTDLLKLVDIDPLLKPIRAKHAERLGLKISDPKVSADPAYKQEVADFVLEWRANPENQGKTLVASTKHLLDPQYKVEFANEPSIPDFETFAARNKARGFKETDEQLRAWYNSILELGRELNIDNRFVSDIESGTRFAKISAEELGGTPKVIRNLPASLRRLLGEGPYDELAGKGIFGDLIGEGSESTVYLHASDPTKVLKVNMDINGTVNKGRHAAIKRYIDQRNSLGIQLPIELEGVVLSHGQYRPVFSLKKVELLPDKLKDYALWKEYEDNVLEPFLLNLGFKRKLGGNYEKLIDGLATYQIGDISPYNIGVDADGNPILFDVDIVRRDWKTGKLFKQGGSIHIKKKNKGKFTASAKAAGEGVQEHAHKVMNDPNATPLQKKRANFAIQAKKWHRKHLLGGKINYLNYFN